jgi:phosphocarrier protein
MIEEKIIIQNKLGLHARAANKLVDVSNQFASEISLTFNDKQVDGKSIMSVMLLAAAKGSQLLITASGSDEAIAMQAIKELINNRFGEDE